MDKLTLIGELRGTNLELKSQFGGSKGGQNGDHAVQPANSRASQGPRESPPYLSGKPRWPGLGWFALRRERYIFVFWLDLQD